MRVFVGRRDSGKARAAYEWAEVNNHQIRCLCGDEDPDDIKAIVADWRRDGHVATYTTNPLVVNEFEPEEVIIVTRDTDGKSVCTPLAETKDFAERSKVYLPGELWLAYFGVDW